MFAVLMLSGCSLTVGGPSDSEPVGFASSTTEPEPVFGFNVDREGFALTERNGRIVVVPGKCWRKIVMLTLSAVEPHTGEIAWQIVNAPASPHGEIVVGRAPHGYHTLEPFDPGLVTGTMDADLNTLEPGWSFLSSATIRFDVKDLEPGTLLANDGQTITRPEIDAESCRGPGD